MGPIFAKSFDKTLRLAAGVLLHRVGRIPVADALVVLADDDAKRDPQLLQQQLALRRTRREYEAGEAKGERALRCRRRALHEVPVRSVRQAPPQ